MWKNGHGGGGEDIETILGSRYREILEALNALRENDESMAVTFNKARMEMGEGKKPNVEKLLKHIDIIGDELEVGELRDAIVVSLIKNLTGRWWEMLGKARSFKEKHGKNPPGWDKKNGGTWLMQQRSNQKDPQKLKLLEEYFGVPVPWGSDDYWFEQCNRAKTYKKKTGKNPRSRDKENGGVWLERQIRNQKDPKKRKLLVLFFGPLIGIREKNWLENFHNAKIFKKKKKKNPKWEDKKSSHWIAEQMREQKNPKKRKLLLLFFKSTTEEREKKWMDQFYRAKAFKKKNGKNPPTEDKKNGGTWLKRQLQLQKNPKKLKLLSYFDPPLNREKEWMKRYNKEKAYKEKTRKNLSLHGRPRENGGWWVKKQMRNQKDPKKLKLLKLLYL